MTAAQRGDERIDMTEQEWAEEVTFGDLLRRTALAHPDQDALVFPGERVTYREFVDRVDGFARTLRALDVGPGDHVGALMPNSIDFMAIFYAAATLGAVMVPVNARFKTEELGYVIDNADIKVLFTSDEISEYVDFPSILEQTFPGLSEADPWALKLPRVPALRTIVLKGAPRVGFAPLTEALRRGDSVDQTEIEAFRRRVRPSDIALLMYTSGTTANPKGCLLTHASVVRNGINFATTKFHMRTGERMWNPLPFFHMGALLPFTACVSSASAMISTHHFKAAEALDALESERVTIAYPAFETIWRQVLELRDFDARDLSALRTILIVAVPESLREMQLRVPWAAQIASFGSTEVSGVACYNEPSDALEDRVTTCGTPFPGVEVRAVDPVTLQDVPAGERGELWVRGYSVFQGYYKDQQKTDEVLLPDGWFRTGDLGTVDSRGQVAFHGRLKDMLKIGGENVAAIEIENFLATHPAVAVVAVVGAPDPRYAEVAAAYVQLKEGAHLEPEELIAYCRGRIASFKVPRHVRIVNEWPFSGTKIKKHVLRDQIAAELTNRAAD